MTASWRILEGDCRDVLRSLDAGSVQTCVTSPPYFGLRDYGHDGQIGLEPTPDEFVAALVGVFREVRRVLRDDGTVWLNLGDSYNNRARVRPSSHQPGLNSVIDSPWSSAAARAGCRVSLRGGDLKEKDLLGIPWMTAFALRADGWYLRSDIIWSKPACMPESVTDRPTRAHEYLFLLSKGPRYVYDADAIREPHDGALHAPGNTFRVGNQGGGRSDEGYGERMAATWGNPAGRNKRSVWTVATQPFSFGALQGGNAYTASPDCPTHGLRACPERWRRAADDAPQDQYQYRIDSNNARRALAHPDADGASSDPHSFCSTPNGSARTSESTDASRMRGPSSSASAGACDETPARTMSSPAEGASRSDTRHSPARADALPASAHSTESRRNGAPTDQGGSDAGALFDHIPSTEPIDAPPALDGSDSRAKSGTRGRNPGRCTCVEILLDHFATFPPKLIEPCILAGCPEGGTVLDPFAGAGTTGMVALRHGRSFVGIELSADYVRLARGRIIADSPLLNTYAEFDAA